MSHDRKPITAPKLPKGGAASKSISMDCKENRHKVCIHENCDCCHDGQQYVHGHWRTPAPMETP